jgi:serine/threonine protein kinase
MFLLYFYSDTESAPKDSEEVEILEAKIESIKLEEDEQKPNELLEKLKEAERKLEEAERKREEAEQKSKEAEKKTIEERRQREEAEKKTIEERRQREEADRQREAAEKTVIEERRKREAAEQGREEAVISNELQELYLTCNFIRTGLFTRFSARDGTSSKSGQKARAVTTTASAPVKCVSESFAINATEMRKLSDEDEKRLKELHATLETALQKGGTDEVKHVQPPYSYLVTQLRNWCDGAGDLMSLYTPPFQVDDNGPQYCNSKDNFRYPPETSGRHTELRIPDAFIGHNVHNLNTSNRHSLECLQKHALLAIEVKKCAKLVFSAENAKDTQLGVDELCRDYVNSYSAPWPMAAVLIAREEAVLLLISLSPNGHEVVYRRSRSYKLVGEKSEGNFIHFARSIRHVLATSMLAHHFETMRCGTFEIDYDAKRMAKILAMLGIECSEQSAMQTAIGVVDEAKAIVDAATTAKNKADVARARYFSAETGAKNAENAKEARAELASALRAKVLAEEEEHKANVILKSAKVALPLYSVLYGHSLITPINFRENTFFIKCIAVYPNGGVFRAHITNSEDGKCVADEIFKVKVDDSRMKREIDVFEHLYAKDSAFRTTDLFVKLRGTFRGKSLTALRLAPAGIALQELCLCSDEWREKYREIIQRDIGEALKLLHANDVVYNDLHQGNVLLSLRFDKAILCDFESVRPKDKNWLTIDENCESKCAALTAEQIRIYEAYIQNNLEKDFEDNELLKEIEEIGRLLARRCWRHSPPPIRAIGDWQFTCTPSVASDEKSFEALLKWLDNISAYDGYVKHK